MAFLTSFGQNFNSTWTSEQVYGRNDPIANFQGTQRTLNVAWEVPSGDVEEAEKNMKKISTLTKMLYPGYSQGTIEVEKDSALETELGGTRKVIIGSNALSLSKAPLIRLKFANLINSAFKKNGEGLLGYVGNMSANPVLDMGMYTKDKKLFPKVYSISIDFTVLHEHDLGKTLGEKSFSDAPSFPFGG